MGAGLRTARGRGIEPHSQATLGYSNVATCPGTDSRGYVISLSLFTMAKTVDIKLQFEQYDMTPGAAGRIFRRNLLAHGGRPDERGYSLADTYSNGTSVPPRLPV